MQEKLEKNVNNFVRHLATDKLYLNDLNSCACAKIILQSHRHYIALKQGEQLPIKQKKQRIKYQ